MTRPVNTPHDGHAIADGLVPKEHALLARSLAHASGLAGPEIEPG